MNNEDVRRELEQYIAHHHATNVEGVTDAVVASPEEEDEDALLEAMTRAVNPRFLGDDGTQTGTPSSSLPVGDALNNAELDDAMTEYFNQGI
jgi:hypothetical protein